MTIAYFTELNAVSVVIMFVKSAFKSLRRMQNIKKERCVF